MEISGYHAPSEIYWASLKNTEKHETPAIVIGYYSSDWRNNTGYRFYDCVKVIEGKDIVKFRIWRNKKTGYETGKTFSGTGKYQ